MRYGLPYKGSKNKIAEWVLAHLPSAPRFYDLFAGGCAMTHAALVSGRYGEVYANDIRGDVVKLFYDAATGNLPPDWLDPVDRETFEARKADSALVRIVWSFGNNGDNYLYNMIAEPAKLAAHRALTAPTLPERLAAFYRMISLIQNARAEYEKKIANLPDVKSKIADTEEYLRSELRRHLKESGHTAADVDRHLGTQMSGLYFGRSQFEFPTPDAYEKIRELCPNFPPLETYGNTLDFLWAELERLQSLQSLESLQRLQSLESLQRLQSLESLQRLPSMLHVSALDYQAVEILPDSVVYCDPPYRNTKGYGVAFDFDRFDAWLRRTTFPVYVSEYRMPADFVCIAEKAKTSTLGAHNNTKTVERLFLHKRWAHHAPPGEQELPLVFD